MPAPFEFSPYHDANADQTIAALLQDRGRIQAEGARASGNAWAGAVQSIGQQVGQIPQQIQQQKEQGIRDAATQAQTAATTAATAERVSKQQQDAYVDRIMKDALVPDPQTGTTKIDRAKFEANLVSGGQGHLYKEWQPALDAMEDKAMRRAAVNRELWADVLVGIHRAGDTPQSMLTGMAYLKSNGAISDAAYTSAQAQLEQDASPTGIKAFVDQAGSKIPEFGAALTTFQKQQADLAKSTADTAKTEADTKKINAEVAGTLPATPAQQATQQYQTGMLKVAQENAATNARRAATAEQAANPLAAVTGGKPAATATSPTGDDFLKTLPANIQSEVKAYAEGRRPFPSGMALKSPYFQSLIQLVGQYDPTFDAANYNARNKARTDLTSPNGQGAKTINALNTVLQHAGKLSDLIEKLDNYESPIGNAIVNPLRKATGNTAVTNYNAVAPQVMKEIERAWRGTGGSAGEIKDLIASLSVNLGKQQQREGLQQLMELVKGKLDATQTQRDNIMGPAASSIPILFDQNKGIIDKITQRAGGEKGTIAEGTDGTVNGVPAVWRKGDKGLGWYAR